MLIRLLCVFAVLSQNIYADELWVLYAPGCYHCEKFLDSAYSNYPNKKLWQSELPVPIIKLYNIALGMPEASEHVLKEDVNATPTFILINDDKDKKYELGRFDGYTDENTFYKELRKIRCEHTEKIKCEN